MVKDGREQERQHDRQKKTKVGDISRERKSSGGGVGEKKMVK